MTAAILDTFAILLFLACILRLVKSLALFSRLSLAALLIILVDVMLTPPEK